MQAVCLFGSCHHPICCLLLPLYGFGSKKSPDGYRSLPIGDIDIRFDHLVIDKIVVCEIDIALLPAFQIASYESLYQHRSKSKSLICSLILQENQDNIDVHLT